ncbi:DUF1254 domain-containing protein [Flavobacterium sp. LHD-80]|uniref:DUF1254 domain-containing protein n=1 Tax=Flavobacterium sp. LHD-80 TaxID=3071411 RepID=UPI0027DFFB00|nr:DUF1254 domain-containing protein [Flavobacterium sp. LHD-80]MDQ6469874.1 DUF1254 domain-containing protein [Flavobacterium sp. LHD-80]
MKKYFLPFFAFAVLTISSLISCKKETQINNTVDTEKKDTITSVSLPSGPVPNTNMTPEYIKTLASNIYLWAWPMVNMHNRKLMFEKLPYPLLNKGVLAVGSINHLGMLTDYVNPLEREVACPNQDVVYGGSPIDLSKDAVVIQVPDFGDRFWVYQVCDQRTDGFAELGKMYGTKPGFYLLTTKDWNGKVPDGITAVFKSATAFGMVIPRVFQSDDPADKKAVQPIISQINVYPLSDFDGKMKITDYTKLPSTPPDKEVSKHETLYVNPEVFFDELPVVLKEVPPFKGEEQWYAQIQAFLDAIAKNPELKKIAKQAGIDAEKNLIEPLFQFQNVGYPVKYNWTTQKNGAGFGVDYLTRVACAKSNIFVNKPNESKYFYQDFDENKGRLNGNNKYTITFAKGETPPVKGFWSLTLYDEHHFFSPNELKRYSLGTKNKGLKYNPDGSLTLYVQNVKPDADKINNWLPAPKGIFSLYVRCYWPEQKVLSDQWTPPAVVKL